ncbi:MAG: Crp/Fnr family transcriptional regulator [Paludibacteraceae bacterium]|nr:Crp/Fnr family transcriptional regulator [Paludibacteraceae bacterium]
MTKEPALDLYTILPQTRPWDTLSAEQLAYVIGQSKLQNIKKNGLIYAEGEDPRTLICILSGKVKIFKTGIEGRNQIVRIVKAGEMLGYRAMFAEEKYVTTATAFEPCAILAIPKQVILDLLHANNELAFAFIRYLSIDLGIADARSVVLTQNHIRGRLAESLLHIYEYNGVEETTGNLAISLSREDLAGLSNMTTSNAIRTLSSFAEDGLIQVSGRKIRLLDLERLRHIAKFE